MGQRERGLGGYVTHFTKQFCGMTSGGLDSWQELQLPILQR